MLSLLLTIVAVSLAGSLHCAGMCGAFVVFAVGGQDRENAKAGGQWRAQAAYHGGRLLTYALLGALAGGVGSVVDLAAKEAKLQHAAAWLAGGVMVAVGLMALAKHWSGLRAAAWKPPAGLTRLLTAGHRAAAGLTPVRRALAIGLLTTLLPCGWLWTFALAAAGTGSPWKGAAVMAAFWTGTVPVLAVLGAGVKKAMGLFGPRLHLAGAVAVIALGLWMIISRDGVSMVPWAKAKEAKQAQVSPVNASQAVQVAAETDDCPYCRKDGKRQGGSP
jgi:sulfite exporter TauE/SafE